MNLLVLGHFIFMLSIVRESLQIKCYSCVDHGKQHGSNMPLPGFQEFRMPNNSDAEFPDIPSKPCGKLGKDSMVNCPGASVTCYKIVRDKMLARSCGLDKASCEGMDLKGCYSCDKDGCNTASKTIVGGGTLLVSILVLRIGI